MTWILITIFSYLIMAGVNLLDKHLIRSALPNPKVYSFYVGILFLLTLVLAPFVGFYVPNPGQIILAMSAGASFVFGLLWFYKALNGFEASRIVPVVGGMTPIFTFGMVFILSGFKESITIPAFFAFLLLVLGTVLMGFEKNKNFSIKSFGISLTAAFLFSLSFVLSKYAYLALPFWTAFIWRSMGGAALAVCFFAIFPEVRQEVRKMFGSKPKEKKSPKTAIIFVINQGASAGASIMQNWAISLVPLAYVAHINALQGVQYVFLLIFSIILSVKFPEFLKEQASKKLMVQKIIATLIIGAGLAVLAIK
jgi:hypothetical protein